MLTQFENNLSTIVGSLILFAFFVAVIRAALLFQLGLEQGFGVRQKSNLQSIFSEDE
ncbi:MAG: hypothetical protein ABSE46_10665 [Terracidiphilus sp.]|jgi:hypothetical protein